MNNSTKVFAKAWLISKVGQLRYGGSIKDYFIESLKMAYKQVKQSYKSVNEITKTDLIKIMLNHVLIVSFTKKDGTTRFMYGTLNADYIKSHRKGVSASSKTRTVPEHQVIIFDAEINEYRSFILDNLIDYAVIG